MCKAVAYKRLKTMENYKTVTPKSGRVRLQEVVVKSPSIWWAAGCSLWEVPTRGLWSGKFWCFGSVDACERWSQIDCHPNLGKRFLSLSLWAPLKFVSMFKRYEKISWVTNGSHYFYYYLWFITIFLLRSRKDTAADVVAVIRPFRTEKENGTS